MRLFDDKPWLPTEKGKELETEVYGLLKLLFEKYKDEVSPRELAFIVMNEASSQQAYHALMAQSSVAIQKREKRIAANQAGLQAERDLDKHDSGPHSNKGGRGG